MRRSELTAPRRRTELLLLDLDETLLPTGCLLEVRHGAVPCDLKAVGSYAALALHSGLLEVLQELQGQVALGIVSSSPRWYVDQILSHHLPDIQLAPRVTYDDVARIKPDPEPLLAALTMAGIGVDQALYVGDALEDEEACAAIGLRFAAAGWATAQPFDPETPVLLDPRELLTLLQEASWQ